jgi:DNA repair exonuclease SbcCD ATPase subunit
MEENENVNPYEGKTQEELIQELQEKDKMIGERNAEAAKKRVARNEAQEEAGKLREELEKYKRLEKERLEAESLQKGEHEKVIEAKTTELKALRETIEKQQKELEGYKAQKEQEIEEMIKKLNKDNLEAFGHLRDPKALAKIIELQNSRASGSTDGGKPDQIGKPTEINHITDIMGLPEDKRIKYIRERVRGK